MGDDARAFWITAPGRGEIRAEPLPAPGPGDVVVRTLFTGVSRGTEALVWRGEVPASERERMRAPFQAGDFGGPVKYGYCNVGQVEHGPEPLRGRLVFCLYPHQTRYVVPADAVHPLPEGVPPGRAVLAANLETAVNGLWDGAPRVGDRVAVVGAGTVGCLAAWLAARIPGTEVQLVEPNPQKAEVARALGLSLVPPERAAGEADLVIHASGSPDGLATALELAGFEAAIVELSWYGARAVPAPLGGAFHSRRLTLSSSQVGHVATAQRGRWTRRRRMALALELLRDPALDALVSGESPFEELPAVMAALAEAPGSAFCHRIAYARAEHPERIDV
ncbi:MAG TPA: zinc-binding alcohol dehydrogenase [Gammaproteobacteria bacterium]